MKSDYWNVSDEAGDRETGKALSHWRKVLGSYDAKEKKSNDVVAHLQKEPRVPRYWARTLTTLVLAKQK